MSHITTIGDIEFTNGPDSTKGGDQCVQHHAGVREGIKDHCCCCTPCLYVRWPDIASQSGCCRCVPRLLCLVFTPDIAANACCRANSLAVPPSFSGGTAEQPWDHRVTYTGKINGIGLTIQIRKLVDGGPCYWEVSSDDNYISQQIEIDHFNVTCLRVPDVVIAGVVDSSGCVGTISFGASDLVKVPFRRVKNQPPLRMFTPTWQGGPAQCTCSQVPEFLCVEGVRHRGEAREQVQFTWDQGLGDRWSYLPCNGNVTNDQEHIYLRGDVNGNCYLEFDFEQSGVSTNDWANPPNTFDQSQPYNIRPGMVAIESCGCDIYARSEVPEIATIEFPTSRFVNITAGECGCWKYLCSKCRCVPRRVCVTGTIDGNLVIADGIWDGDGWAVAADGYTGAFRVVLGGGVGTCGECVLTVAGTFNVPFVESQVVECGENLTGEMYSEYNAAFPTTFNWLWVTGAPCDCKVSPCFLCLEQRCGGMPPVLYYDITTQAQFIFGYDPEKFCNITVELHYFKRFLGGASRQTICGYIGYTTVYCPPDAHNANARTTVIRVSVISGGPGAFNYQIDMADLSAASPGPLVFNNVFANTNRPAAVILSCDPFVADTGFYSMPVGCRWGCENVPSSEQPTNMREMFTE